MKVNAITNFLNMNDAHRDRLIVASLHSLRKWLAGERTFRFERNLHSDRIKENKSLLGLKFVNEGSLIITTYFFFVSLQ